MSSGLESDALHALEDVFALELDLDADLLAQFLEVLGKGQELLGGLGGVHNHHHVEETADDGLRDVLNVDIGLIEISCDSGDDSSLVLSYDGDD